MTDLCDHLPSLESISLAHAKFTDAGAVHLAKLTRLKGLEIGTSNATPQALVHLSTLPLEYLQLGEGFELGKVPLPVDRLAVLADFAHLKSLRLIPVKEPFTSETQARIRALLPKVELKFQ